MNIEPNPHVELNNARAQAEESPLTHRIHSGKDDTRRLDWLAEQKALWFLPNDGTYRLLTRDSIDRLRRELEG